MNLGVVFMGDARFSVAQGSTATNNTTLSKRWHPESTDSRSDLEEEQIWKPIRRQYLPEVRKVSLGSDGNYSSSNDSGSIQTNLRDVVVEESDPTESYIAASSHCPCNHHNQLRVLKEDAGRRKRHRKRQRRARKMGISKPPESNVIEDNSVINNGCEEQPSEDNWTFKCPPSTQENQVDEITTTSPTSPENPQEPKELQSLDISSISSRGSADLKKPNKRHHDQPDLPYCIRQIILQQLQNHSLLLQSTECPVTKERAKLMKSLSKTILLPRDPEDPAAFTFTPGISRATKKPWCSSKPVYKIVGTFAFLMTLGIVFAIVFVNYRRNTFRPMT